MKQSCSFKRSSKQWLCLVGQSLQQDQDTKQGLRKVKEDHPQKIEPEDRIYLLNSEALFLALA